MTRNKKVAVVLTILLGSGLTTTQFNTLNPDNVVDDTVTHGNHGNSIGKHTGL